MQSVQLFECVKAGYFLITKVLGEHRRDEVIGEGEGRGGGGLGALSLRKYWNFDPLERYFWCFARTMSK